MSDQAVPVGPPGSDDGDANGRKLDEQDAASHWGKRLQNFLIVVIVALTITELYLAIHERGTAHEALRNSLAATDKAAQSQQEAEQAANYTAQRANYTSEIDSLENAVDSLKSEVDKVDEIDKEVERVAKEVHDSNAKAQKLQREMAYLRKGFTNLTEIVKELQDNIKARPITSTSSVASYSWAGGSVPTASAEAMSWVMVGGAIVFVL